MAKVTITIEDKPGGERIEVRCSPKYAEMAKALTGGLSKSNAFSAGLAVANFLHDRAKKNAMGHKRADIIIPRLRRPGLLS